MQSSDKTLDDLFVEVLRDTYSAEKQVLRALGKAINAASSEKLAIASDTHRAETENQIERLQQVFGDDWKTPQRQALRGDAGHP